MLLLPEVAAGQSCRQPLLRTLARVPAPFGISSHDNCGAVVSQQSDDRCLAVQRIY
jgi:hypothetical protein